MKTHSWFVRSPKLSDVEPLLAIATAVSQPTSPIQAITQQANGRFWTITRQDQLIGYAALLPLPGLPYLFELTGGIAPQFQRQGAGSFLWKAVREELWGTAPSASSTLLSSSEQAVQQITYTVDQLDTPAAHFLRHHQFELEHEEWTMQVGNLAKASFQQPTSGGILKMVNWETAVRTLPNLYNRSFAHTPWHQPYSADEVAATWEASDELWTLSDGNESIGFAWLHFPTPKKAVIEPIGIVKEKQGMGYGRFFLTTLLQTMQQRGVQTVSLGVWANNKTAVHLYQSLGFRHVSSKFSLTYTPNQAI